MKTLEHEQENAVQNRSIIDGLYNAFAIGDIPTVLASMDSNIA